MAGRAEVGVGLTLADGRGLERRVKHCHTEADDDEVSLVVVRVSRSVQQYYCWYTAFCSSDKGVHSLIRLFTV